MSNHNTPRQTHRARRNWTAGLVGVAAAAAFAAPAAAAEQPTSAEPDLGPRIERLCDRIPNLQVRTDNVIARLQGDAVTIGSLAWLQTKIDQAEAAGRTELVTLLTNRLAVRTDTVAVLQQRAQGLVELEAWCTEQGA